MQETQAPQVSRFSRRSFVALAGAGMMASAASPLLGANNAHYKEEKEVAANEDLMREHGVLRRILLVWRESAPKLEFNPSNADLKPLHDAAMLFRKFGEDYHEKALEEAYVFPQVRQVGGPAAAYIDVLIAQHNRGRQLTDYILSTTSKCLLSYYEGGMLARVFNDMGTMYENHTAREDTVVFPAWKQTLSDRQYQQMGDKFEDIERQQFGTDGFEQAVGQITAIEQALGYADISQFTAQEPG